MKICIYTSMIAIALFLSCKKAPNVEEVFKPKCQPEVLKKRNWLYCHLHNDNYPIQCDDKNDTLTWKITKTFTDVKGTIKAYTDPGGVFYVIELDETFVGTRANGLSVTVRELIAWNLPDCFSRDNLRVLLSGDLRVLYRYDVGIGHPFELTKIEEIP